MDQFERLSDARLLASARRQPVAFGHFYARCEDPVLLFFLERGASPELAADLTAETFAAAFLSASRYEATGDSPIAWLHGIARNVIALSRRASIVESRARRRLGMPALRLGRTDLDRVAALRADSGYGVGVASATRSYPALAKAVQCSSLMEVAVMGSATEAPRPERVPQLCAALVEAAVSPRPRRPGALAAVGRRAAVLMAAVALVGALPASADASVQRERRAVALFNSALRELEKDRECRPTPPQGT